MPSILSIMATTKSQEKEDTLLPIAPSSSLSMFYYCLWKVTTILNPDKALVSGLFTKLSHTASFSLSWPHPCRLSWLWGLLCPLRRLLLGTRCPWDTSCISQALQRAFVCQGAPVDTGFLLDSAERTAGTSHALNKSPGVSGAKDDCTLQSSL